jgi:elongation factor 1-gamma
LCCAPGSRNGDLDHDAASDLLVSAKPADLESDDHRALCGVEIEIRGAKPAELQSWLWDFDARALSADDAPESASEQTGRTGFKGVKLRKTKSFLDAHPFGTVPAAFSPDGTVGIFESNSIMRAVARLGEGRFPVYGHGPYEASRVDSFLDASLAFARDADLLTVAE